MSGLQESFTVCYLILSGTALITFIEAMRTTDAAARHILNLETAVTLTAGFVYSMLLEKSKASDNINLKEVMVLRYTDWSITTPMLLLALMLFFNSGSGGKVHFGAYLAVVALNYLMLFFGYLGETQRLDKRKANFLGFVAFAAMLAVIWTLFMHSHRSGNQVGVYIAFTAIWSLYGVAAYLDEVTKNYMYNVLDIISKVFFGLYMWLFYGGVAQW
jgi:bacteriorhodopsin